MKIRYAPEPDKFRKFTFNPFYYESFSDTKGERKPDENFFNEINTQNFECSYIFPNKIESFLSEKENSETINGIYVNIRSLSKNFDNLLDILRDSNNSFNVLCITELGASIQSLRIIQI